MDEKPPEKSVQPKEKQAGEAQEKPAGGNVFTVPLRKAFRKAEGKRVTSAVSLVKEFLKRHMKTADVKLGEKLNHAIWERGSNPPRKVRIHALKEGSTVKAELFGYEYKEFKAKPKEEKKGLAEKLTERLGPKAIKNQQEEKMAGSEKKPESAQKQDMQKT